MYCPFCGGGSFASPLGIFLSFLFLFIILVGIGLLIWWIVIQFARPAPRISEAQRILDERYAKGEISKEDYQRMKKELV